MKYEAAWALSCGHQRGFSRPEDEPKEGDPGRCYVCPARLEVGSARVAPFRTYVRKVQ